MCCPLILQVHYESIIIVQDYLRFQQAGVYILICSLESWIWKTRLPSYRRWLRGEGRVLRHVCLFVSPLPFSLVGLFVWFFLLLCLVAFTFLQVGLFVWFHLFGGLYLSFRWACLFGFHLFGGLYLLPGGLVCLVSTLMAFTLLLGGLVW